MLKKLKFILLAILPLSALAHSPIANLIPNDGAILTEAPKEISIEFVNPAMFTKFEITNTEGPEWAPGEVVVLYTVLIIFSGLWAFQTPNLSPNKTPK